MTKTAVAYVDIVNKARVLRGTYRKKTERYRQAERHRANQHQRGIPYGDDEARRDILLTHGHCEHLNSELWALRGLICKHLPAVASNCPLVLAAMNWHMHGVEWDEAETELRVIEVAAQAALDGTNHTEIPGRTIDEKATYLFNENRDLTHKQIADEIGGCLSTVKNRQRCPKYHKARADAAVPRLHRSET